MKVSLISLLAILAISQAHIIEKRDEESDRVEAAEDACYQNECKALHDKFFNECTTYESNDTMDSKYYNCTCDALKNVSDSCKKCMTNTGMNMDADTQEICQYANDINNSTSSNSRKTSSSTSSSIASPSQSPSANTGDNQNANQDGDDGSSSSKIIPSLALVASTLMLIGTIVI